MSISSFDLNLLLVLDTVLEERSVARAAHLLHVTPSAISNSLARLRSVLGDPLVARKGRGIVPTPKALELAPALKRALRELELVVHGAAFDAASCTRTFTLALADAGQVVRLPRIAALMTAEMPRARLRVVGIDSLVSLGGLRGTEVDAVIGPNEGGAGLHTERLFDEAVEAVVRREHPALRKRNVALKHVAVEMAPGTALRDLTSAAYGRAGLEREVVVTVPTFTAAAAVVAKTDLVATLPASLSSALKAPFWLTTLKLAVALPKVTMSLAWHERTSGDASMVAFRALLRRAVSAQGAAKK